VATCGDLWRPVSTCGDLWRPGSSNLRLPTATGHVTYSPAISWKSTSKTQS